MTVRFYWLPFPGMWQCVVTQEDGRERSGMGVDKEAARQAAKEADPK